MRPNTVGVGIGWEKQVRGPGVDLILRDNGTFQTPILRFEEEDVPESTLLV